MARSHALVIGLLGGIGSGKSTVAGILKELGARIIDADVIASECLRDPRIVAEIRQVFGYKLCGPSGTVDRGALARIVFSDDTWRRRLSDIVHPVILARMTELLQRYRLDDPQRLVVVDAPLLLESEFSRNCDVLVMIGAPAEQRAARAAAARGWQAGELERREACQAPLAQKESAAAYTLSNTGSLEDLRLQVRELVRTLEGVDPDGTS